MVSFLQSLFENVSPMEVGILFFGCSAIWFVGRRKPSIRRWGYIMGLCAQPFWLVMLFSSGRYFACIMSLFYAVSWGLGVWNFWIKPESPA